jgi:hypothetical protein
MNFKFIKKNNMKKITILTVMVAMITLSANTNATNWAYNAGTSLWVKNITPEMFQFNNLTTAAVQSSIYVSLGGSNPSPSIKTTTGQDLSNGYFAVSGGQIANQTTHPALVKQGFVITSSPDVIGTAGLLRIAGNSSTVTDGKLGLTGYISLSWYIPTKYNRAAYNFVISDSIYTTASAALSLTTYNEADTRVAAGTDYSTVSATAAGWSFLTLTQIPAFTPFRIKLGLPNLAANNAYIKTPRFELTSVSEPTVRTITKTVNFKGSVTVAYPLVRDQDVQIFTITPDAGQTLISTTYNASTVTPVDNGNGTYTYTTPLLTADGTIEVTFSNNVTTGFLSNNLSAAIFTASGNLLKIENISSGQQIQIFSLNGIKVFSATAHQSSYSIPLKKGLYVVKVDNQITKIIL